jgi:hypothetical protein
MRKSMLALVASVSLVGGLFVTAPSSRGDDEKEIKGVLIDQQCAAKFTGKDDPEAAAAGHPKACCIKCADGGFEVISGKTEYKFDDASNAKAKAYLDANDSTKVVVKGTEKDGTITVSSIEAQK